MDYRELLKKYIRQVGLNEGVSFISENDGPMNGTGITEEEWAELRKLDEEVKP